MAKKKNISLSIDPEFEDFLRIKQVEKGFAYLSTFIIHTLEKYLVKDESLMYIMLKIPVELKKDKVALKQWLDVRTADLVEKLAD